QSDVYSFSMAVWEILTGVVPLRHYPRDAVSYHVVVKGTRPVQATPLGLSDAVWALIEQCWQADYRARPAIHSVVPCLKDALQRTGSVKLTAPKSWPLNLGQ
ncbi:hypothetical protein OBBRIDRAFT_734653, partial [Obba rivulosa]